MAISFAAKPPPIYPAALVPTKTQLVDPVTDAMPALTPIETVVAELAVAPLPMAIEPVAPDALAPTAMAVLARDDIPVPPIYVVSDAVAGTDWYIIEPVFPIETGFVPVTKINLSVVLPISDSCVKDNVGKLNIVLPAPLINMFPAMVVVPTFPVYPVAPAEVMVFADAVQMIQFPPVGA